MPEAPTALKLKTDPRSLQFKHIFETEGFQGALRAVLPKHISPNKMVRLALGEFHRVPKLLQCTPESVLYSLLTAGSMGLEIGGPLGQGYLVPFWNKKTQRTECQFIPGYRGLVKLARNSGEIEDVYAAVAYAKDTFSYEQGLSQTLTHKRNDEDMDVGSLRYAYAVGVFRSGYKKFEVMNRREIEAIKARSNSRNKEGRLVGPWVEDEPEMWKKSAVRRLAKMLPLSVDVQRLVGGDDDELDIKLPDLTALPAFESPQLESSIDVSSEAPEQAPDPEPDPLAALRAELAACPTQTACNEIDAREQSQEVHELVEARKAEIKATRGGKTGRESPSRESAAPGQGLPGSAT